MSDIDHHTDTSDPLPSVTDPADEPGAADDPVVDREAAAAGQVAAAAAEVYERFFVPALFGQWPPILLGRAGVGLGHRVLDVGCGTGIVARAAAERVGATGSVIGLDPNPGMLAVAAQAGAGTGVEWRSGVAEDLPFEADRFDRVLAQFTLMFFADREAGMAEMARVAAPGGSVTVATWSTIEESPGYAAMAGLLDRLFGREAADALRAPFVLGQPDEVAALLTPHLDDVEVTRVGGTARFPSIADWVHTDVRGWTLADAINDTQLEVLLAEAERELAPFAGPDGVVTFPAPAVVATGRVGPAGSGPG